MVNNNYTRHIKKIQMSLIKNILSLKDMRILRELFQLKKNLKLMRKKLIEMLKKSLMKLKIKRKRQLILNKLECKLLDKECLKE
jgi:hypothetical protein